MMELLILVKDGGKLALNFFFVLLHLRPEQMINANNDYYRNAAV